MKEAAFTMTGRAIQIDKRLPCFIGGRAGILNQTGCGRPTKDGMSRRFDKGNV